MSFTIDQAFVNQYNDNILLLSQQFQSRLAQHVTLKAGIVGEAATVERLAPTEARIVTSRHEDSPLISTTHSRRWLTASTRDWGELIDKEDEVRMLISPSSSYVRDGIAALERAKDAVIAAAATGSSKSGKDGSSSVALPSAQKIAVGGTGLTLAKIVETAEKMNNAEIPPEGRVFVHGARQLSNLLNDSTITSALYNEVRLLMSGQVRDFMGFTWVRYERLPKVSTSRFCFAFHPQYLTLGLFQDNQSRITERADKRFSMYVYMWNVLGAVRTQEEGVVEVECLES